MRQRSAPTQTQRVVFAGPSIGAVRGMKAAGCSVLIMAHRPAAIAECDTLLVLENGMRRAFGPREEVLRAMVQNATELVRNAGPGGVA